MRRFAAQLDALPGALRQVACWRGPTATARTGHQHHVPTLVAGLAGVTRIDGPLGSIDLRPGDALLIAPGVWHHHVPVRPGSACFGQGFIATWSDILLTDAERPWFGRIPAQPSRRLIEAALAAGEAGRTEAVRALLVHVLGESALPALTGAATAWRMMQLLWRRAHLGVSGADLIAASGRGRTQACAGFQRAFGISPYQAVLQARIGLAEGLVAAGLPIGEVAARTGFASRRAFNRAWRRAHGGSPRRRA